MKYNYQIIILILSSFILSFSAYSQTGPYEDLLEHRSGFAESVTGGQGGTVIIITAVGDVGFIQLKNAVHEKDNPKWVRFTPGLSGEILIDQWLAIGSNTTIDGRGANITFKGKNTADELFVWGDTNVIVHNIRFYQMGTTYDEGTAFGMSRGADMVWLDHCTFEDNSDESVTIGNEGGTPFRSRLTLSYCSWTNTIRAILLGHNKDEGELYQVSIHHCSFISGPENIMYRIPKLRHGKVHMYNNYVKDYDWRATAVQNDGEALIEHNIYTTAEGAAMFCAADSYDPEPGWICDKSNHLFGGTDKVGDGFICDSVFEASVYYNYQADTSTEVIQSLAISYAGRSDVPLWVTESSPRPYQLTLDLEGEGKVTVNPSRAVFYENEIVNLFAEPENLGFAFSHWSGDINTTENPAVFSMDESKHIVANFLEVPVYTLTTEVVGEGHVSSMANGDYNVGSKVKITAFPNWGFEFLHWEDDYTGNDNPITISIDSNTAITAVFSGGPDAIDEDLIAKDILKNYPNPCESSTTIRFNLEKQAFVKLSVFNTNGKEMKVLFNERLAAGQHEIELITDKWPTGTYYYNFQSGEFIQTKKLIIQNGKF